MSCELPLVVNSFSFSITRTDASCPCFSSLCLSLTFFYYVLTSYGCIQFTVGAVADESEDWDSILAAGLVRERSVSDAAFIGFAIAMVRRCTVND